MTRQTLAREWLWLVACYVINVVWLLIWPVDLPRSNAIWIGVLYGDRQRDESPDSGRSGPSINSRIARPARRTYRWNHHEYRR